MTATLYNHTVLINGEEFGYQRPWNGHSLTLKGLVGFDTETEVRSNNWVIPRLALATASANGSHCLIHPDQVGAFILAHSHAQFVFHNAAFDFWVIDRHLRERHEKDARQAWRDACDQNRMHDTMLLDQLISLARRDADPHPRDLATVAKEYTRLEIDKSDPYRLRYGDIIGKDWAEVEEGFFTYAIKDAIVTLQLYYKLALVAQQLMRDFASPDVRSDAIQKFGLLTEAVQVKGAVALEQVSRHGVHLNVEQVQQSESELRAMLDQAIRSLHASCPELFKTRNDKGQQVLLYPEKGVAPSKNGSVLVDKLTQIIDEIHKETGRRLSIPKTKKNGALSISTKKWAEYAELHPFLESWIKMESLAKLCQFFGNMHAPVVHPRYRHLLRTGRTSCSGPNIQQIPREGRFRQAFVASPGHFLLAVDYSFIELRTLAAVYLQRYGRSVLADVIKQGTDPHAYTAALILGMPLDEFLAWKNDRDVIERRVVDGQEMPVTRADKFKQYRQAAKAVNFGAPGGLGAESLVSYARQTYGVDMSLDEARSFRDRLSREIYPELSAYLSEDGMSVLARNLKTTATAAWTEFDWERKRSPWIIAGVKRIVSGHTKKSNGGRYNSRYYNGVWGGLIELCQDPELKQILEQRQGSKALCQRLFHAGVATLTGRIRGQINFCQARNTPFQGLAADGAKLALWRLISAGFRVVGFVHDEILVELPDEGGYCSEGAVKRVKKIMCAAMQEVLIGEIPVDCEAALSRCWSKEAKEIIRDGKVYSWEPPSARYSASR